MTAEPVCVLAKDGRRRNIGAILDRNRMRFQNLTGKQFTRWVVIAFAGKDQRGQSQWRVKCTHCGNERVVLRGNLVKGKTRSDGCLRAEMMAAKMTAAHALISEAMKASEKDTRNLRSASER